VFALDPPGPVSARLYTRIEARLVSSFSGGLGSPPALRAPPNFLRHLAALAERLEELGDARAPLGDAEDEWIVASDLRLRFREIERFLGEAASTQLFGRYLRVASTLGVRISSARGALPPLAQAIFESLAHDAERYGDTEGATLMKKNVKLTKKFD
jgi:hypothetical protein